jgi:glycerol-3-phosphate acyltransferase PlsX
VTRPSNGRVVSDQRRDAGAPEGGITPRPGTARIAVDLLGGDEAPAVVVDGALHAVQADPAVHLLLVGPAEAAGEVLAALAPPDRARVRTISTSTVGRTGKTGGSSGETGGSTGQAGGRPGNAGWIESGVRAAVLAVAEGEADAVVSAGSTGATVTSAALGCGRWPGVRRPALAAVLPTVTGRLVLLDVGATVDPDERALLTQARLGAAYASVAHEVAQPRVGLLTIGTERGKGDRLRRAMPALLSEAILPAGARYVGLIEGDDVVTGGAADVVVTDGFTGNVLLKGLETAYARIAPPRPGDVPPRAATLLGVSGTVVVCHGAASAADLAAGIALAADLHRRVAVPAIAALMERSGTDERSGTHGTSSDQR